MKRKRGERAGFILHGPEANSRLIRHKSMMAAETKPTRASVLRPAVAPEYANDRALVKSVLAGDVRAAGAFHARVRPPVEQTLRRILRGRRRDLDDLVQITLERAFRALAADRYEGRSSLSTWVSGIATHVALDDLRRSFREDTRFVSVVSEEHGEDCISAERRLEARSELDRLHGILSRMKPTLAESLLLHDVLGHSLAEVAEMTQCSLTAAQSRLLRARKDLVRRASALVARGGGAS